MTAQPTDARLCPVCGSDITKGHHSRLQGCFPATDALRERLAAAFGPSSTGKEALALALPVVRILIDEAVTGAFEAAVQQLEREVGAGIDALSDEPPESLMKKEARARLGLWKSNIRHLTTADALAALDKLAERGAILADAFEATNKTLLANIENLSMSKVDQK